MAPHIENRFVLSEEEAVSSAEHWQEAASQGDPQAQYRLGKAYLARENLSRGRRWLARAVENGCGEAACDLGLMHVLGLGGVPIAPPDGIHWLRRGAELGNAEAMAWMAQFSFIGHGLDADQNSAREWLLKAARLDEPMALCQLGFVYARLSPAAEWEPRAFACLARAASLGDEYAAHACGVRLLEGRGTDKDERTGYAWLSQAARAGVYLSQQRLGESTDSNTSPLDAGVPALVDFDWPAPRQARLDRLSEEPPVYRITDLIEAEVCEYLINRAHPHLEPARTVNPNTGQSFTSNIRTNSNAGFIGAMLDIPAHLVELDMMHLAQGDVRCAERLAMLRYGPGEEYKPHFDYINPHAKDSVAEYQQRGQRVKTIFAYLNDVSAGGETDFPRLGLKLKPERGGGVMFYNTTPEGKPHKDTLHAGCPVIEGEKWLATLWVRERPVVNR